MIRFCAIFVLSLSLVPAASGADGLEQTQSRRLSEIYDKTSNPDQRFWIIHTLGARLKEHSDPVALETLMDAAKESSGADVRVPALRALADYFTQEDREIPEPLLARLDALGQKGRASDSAAVRNGASTLLKRLEIRRNPAKRTTPKPPGPGMGSGKLWTAVMRVLRWLWLLVLPFVVLLWGMMGLPVFDSVTVAGARARAAWEGLYSQKVLLSLCVVFWLMLAAMSAGYGFDLLALTLGRPMYEVGAEWTRAYLAIGLSLFFPGALLAAGMARRPSGSAWLSSLRAVFGIVVLWAVVFTLLVPLEALYRLLWRSGRSARRLRGGFAGLLERGALRSGYFAASVMACEDMGMIPALKRSGDLAGDPQSDEKRIGFACFDLRFGLLCAAPVLAFFCALVAKGQPVQWRVSWPLVMLGCSLWSWSVLIGVLFAVLQSLEGVAAARLYRRTAGSDADEWREI